MLEAYQAYTDYRGMMELTRSLIQQVAERALGGLQMERSEGDAIDLSGDWKEAKYKDLIIDAVGQDDWFRYKDAKLEKTKTLGIEVDPALEDFEITNDVFEKIIEHTLIQPTFVTHIPENFVPWLRLLKLILPQLMYLSFVLTVRKLLQRILSKMTLQYNGKPS